MKIYIIGPSCSGKTTLSKFFNRKLKIPVLSIDKVLISVDPITREKIKLPDDKALPIINNFLRQRSWILEGIQPYFRGLKAADIIIYLMPNMFVCLYRQWKRCLFDSEQHKYGVRNNLRLTISIIKQYLEKEDSSKYYNYRFSRVWKFNKICEDFKGKVILVKDTNQRNYGDLLTQVASYNKQRGNQVLNLS